MDQAPASTPHGVPEACRLRIALEQTVRQFGRWESRTWQLARVDLPGDGAPPPADGEFDVELRLYRDQADDYRANLAGRTPQLFVICRPDEEERMRPDIVTLCQADSVSHLETDDEVLSCPLSGPLRDWVTAWLVLVPLPAVEEKRRQRGKGDKGRRGAHPGETRGE